MELVCGLVGLCLLGFYLIAPVVALARTSGLGDLLARLERLETRLDALARRTADAPREVAAPPVEAEPPVTQSEGLQLPQQPPPLTPAATVPSTFDPFSPSDDPPPEPRPARDLDDWFAQHVSAAGGLEALLGGRVLGWAAVVLLVFAAGFFLKYAFDNGWIGPVGQVCIGLAVGVGLCEAGARLLYHGRRVGGQMFAAAGTVVLYLSVYAAFGFYPLVSKQTGGAFLAVLMVEAAILAALAESPGVALLAVLGGLLTPVLLRDERDLYGSFFVYLAVLNAGVLGLVHFRPWPGLRTIAFVGTQLLFFRWMDEHDHPEKRPAALLFQATLVVLYLGDALVSAGRRRLAASEWVTFLDGRPADQKRVLPAIEDVFGILLVAVLPFVAAYRLLDEDYHAWMGTLALAWATLFAALATAFDRRASADPARLMAAVAVSMGYVATAIPLQADAGWVATGWAAEGLCLWWFGLRVRAGPLRLFGVVLLLMAVGRCLRVDYGLARREWVMPLFNAGAMSVLAVAAALVGVALTARRFVGHLTVPDHIVRNAAGLGGLGLVWVVLTRETYDYFSLTDDSFFQGRFMAQMAVSAVWAFYAAVLLAVGMRWRRPPIRYAALALFVLTLAKVLLIDLSGLAGIYRVLAFFIVALVLAAAAWAYGRFGRWAGAASG